MNNIDIMILTETDMDAVETGSFRINGYDVVEAIPSEQSKIRTLMLINKRCDLKHQVMWKHMSKDVPGILIRIQTKSQSIIIGGLYRPWTKKEKESYIKIQEDELELFFNQVKEVLTLGKQSCFYLIGDWNLDLRKLEDKSWALQRVANKMKEFLSETGAIILQDGPTFFPKNSDSTKESTLDYIVTNDQNPAEAKQIQGHFTDHEGIMIKIKTGVKKTKNDQYIVVRQRIRNQESFKTKLRTLCDRLVSDLQEATDIDHSFTIIASELMNLFEKYSPFRQRKINPRHVKLSQKAKRLKKEREIAKEKFINAANNKEKQTLKNEFNRIHKSCSQQIKNDIEANIKEKLNKGKNPWDIMKEYLGEEGNKEKIELEDEKGKVAENCRPDAFNNFFLNKVHRLHESLQGEDESRPVQGRQQVFGDNFSFEPISIMDVKKIIGSLNTNESYGTDKLSSKLIKEYKHELIGLIYNMVNKVLTNGIFPRVLKTSIVSPIYKGTGNKKTTKSYRPVSNLPILGKIIESAMEKQLRKYCEKHNLLGDNQFGYRKNRSRISALISLVTRIREERARGSIVGLLQLDLSSAFDMISSAKLIQQLEKYRVAPSSLELIKSYLTDRSQQVRLNEKLSDIREVKYGSPQGSCISPLLFAIYLGDINSFTLARLTTYADDTVMLVKGTNREQVKKALETEGTNIVNYLKMKRMVANPGKFSLMVFSKKTNSEKMEININNTLIMEKEHSKLLGVVIRNDLSWKEDIENTIKEAKYRNLKLRQAQRYFNTETLRVLGHGLVMSKLCSNLPAYGYSYLRVQDSDPKNILITKMQVEQNEMMRTVLKVKRTDKISTKEMLKTLKMKSINQTIAKDVLLETWKTKEFKIEDMYSRLNQKRGDGRMTRGTKNPIRTLTRDPSSFPCIAEKLWNSCPEKIRKSNILDIVKKEIGEFVVSFPI